MPIGFVGFLTTLLFVATIIILFVKMLDGMSDGDWKVCKWIPLILILFVVWISCAFKSATPTIKTVNVSIIDNTAICIWDDQPMNLNLKFKRQFSEGPLNLVYFPNMSYGISFDTVKLDATSDQDSK